MDSIRQVRLSSKTSGSVSGTDSNSQKPVSSNHAAASKQNIRSVDRSKISVPESASRNRAPDHNAGSKPKSGSPNPVKNPKRPVNQRNNKTKQKAGKPKNGAKKAAPQKSSKKSWPIYLVAGLALALLVYTALEFLYKPQEKIPVEADRTKSETSQKETIIADNIYFSDMSLAKLSYEDFDQQLKAKSDQLLDKVELNLKNEKNDKKPKLTAKLLGYSFDAQKMYENAEKLTALMQDGQDKKTENFSFRVAEAGNMPAAGDIEGLAKQENDKLILLPVYKENSEILENEVKNLVKDLSQNEVTGDDIKFNVETLQFEFPEYKQGYTLDEADLLKQIREAFAENKVEDEIKLVFKDNESQYDPKVLAEETGLLGTGYTEFVTYDPNRDINVNRVAELLNGQIVMPGEVFSYWEGIDPVTVENGFTQGYQIAADGSTELVLAGGVCQGSSTLYNAVVRSDLEIVERNNHTIPSLYITQGLDAMVSSWSDFKFKNNSDFPIAIVGKCVPEEYVQFEIYGKKLEDGLTIDMDPYYIGDDYPGEAKRVPVNDLPEGEERTVRAPIVGSFWKTDKVYYKDGVEIKREFLNNSHYWAYNAIIEYGTGPKSTTSSESSSETTTDPTSEITDPTTTPSSSEIPSETEPPETEPPATEPSATEPPETEPPATEPTETEPLPSESDGE